MNKQTKTNAELIEEISSLKQRIQELEQAESERKRTEEDLKKSEEKYRTILENMQEGYFEMDLAGNYTFVNDAECRNIGYSKEELIGMNNRQYQDETTAQKMYQFFRRLYRTGEPVKALDVEIIRKNGTKGFNEVSVSLIRDAEGKPIGFRGISRDVTERKRMEEQLRYSQQELQALMDNSPIGICWADMQGNIQYINRKFLALFGYTVEDIPNIAAWRSLAYPSPAYREQVPSLIGLLTKAQKQGKEADSLEITVTCKDGSTRHVLQAGTVTFNRILVTYDDITERKRIEEALKNSEKRYRELSIIDDLTQLYNSRHFYHQLKMETDRADRYGQPLTLLLLDLDDFKRFNDAYGHVEGDQVLLRLGQVVKRCLRQTDSAYRYGGEEFTIILPMTTSADGSVTAERIRTEFKKENFSPAPGQEFYLTVSIGLAQYKPQEDMKAFVHRVDQLMYQGKKNGKDRVCSEL
jgi:diguanylate cyclase (GGDEF)-like protein/PAS domain S-box-containing protein